MSAAKKALDRRELRGEALLLALLDAAGIRISKDMIATWTPAQRADARAVADAGLSDAAAQGIARLSKRAS